VFDKGQLADGEGRDIDFRNTVLLLTSNLGADVMTELCSQPGTTHQKVADAVRPILSKHFKPALLARMTMVPFMPLSANAMREIVDLKLGHLRDRISDTHHIDLQIGEPVANQIVMRCGEVETGARNIDHIVSRTLLPMLSRALLDRMARGDMPDVMRLDLDGEDYALSFEAAP
jgi:type VI secretion system protein VasG